MRKRYYLKEGELYTEQITLDMIKRWEEETGQKFPEDLIPVYIATHKKAASNNKKFLSSVASYLRIVKLNRSESKRKQLSEIGKRTGPLNIKHANDYLRAHPEINKETGRKLGQWTKNHEYTEEERQIRRNNMINCRENILKDNPNFYKENAKEVGILYGYGNKEHREKCLDLLREDITKNPDKYKEHRGIIRWREEDPEKYKQAMDSIPKEVRYKTSVAAGNACKNKHPEQYSEMGKKSHILHPELREKGRENFKKATSDIEHQRKAGKIGNDRLSQMNYLNGSNEENKCRIFIEKELNIEFTGPIWFKNPDKTTISKENGIYANHPYDFGLKNKKLIIEYDGIYWHKNNKLKDDYWTKVAIDKGWKIIRIDSEPWTKDENYKKSIVNEIKNYIYGHSDVED